MLIVCAVQRNLHHLQKAFDDLQKDPRSHENIEDEQSTVSRPPDGHDDEAEDRQSGGAGSAKSLWAVRLKQDIIVRKTVPVRMTAPIRTKGHDQLEDHGSQDMEEDVSSTISGPPGEHDSGDGDRKSNGDTSAIPTITVTIKNKVTV